MQAIKSQLTATAQQALYTRLTARCARLTEEHTASWLQTLLDDSEQALNELARQSSDARLRTVCHDAIRELKLKRDDVLSGFNARLSAYLNGDVQAQAAHATSNGTDDLKLLLALDPIARRAEAAARNALQSLQAQLIRQTGLPVAISWPINAMKLGDLYLQALAPVSADFRIMLALLKLLDAHVYAHLPALYATLEQSLQSEPAVIATPTATKADTTPRQQILYTLNRLQTAKHAPDLGVSMQDWVLVHLPATLREDAALQHALAALDKLYSNLQSKPGMYQPLASELNLMRTALLKLIMLDKNFLTQPGHPARRLLTAMMQIGPALAEATEAASCLMSKLHDDVVLRINREFASNPALFDEVLQDFNNFLAREQHSHLEQQHQHIRQAQAGEEVAFARTYVEQELAIRCAGRRLNPDTVQLLREVWSEALAAIYLKEGATSPHWELAMEITDDLLQSCDEAIQPEQRQQMAALLPQLIAALKEDLSEIDWQNIKIDGLFEQLNGMPQTPASEASVTASTSSGGEWIYAADLGEWVLASSLHNPVPDSTPAEELTAGGQYIFDLDHGKWRKNPRAATTDTTPTAETVYRAADLPSSPVQDDEYMIMARQIKPGDWIELTTTDGEKLRARLAWKGDIANKLIFVNWRQQVVAEPTLAGLAMQLRNGSARLLDARQ